PRRGVMAVRAPPWRRRPASRSGRGTRPEPWLAFIATLASPLSILYLLLWIAIPFLFFSLSQSKRPQYILPLMPAVALLVARVWCDAKRGTRIAAAVLMVLGAACLAAPQFIHLRNEFSIGGRATAISFGA